jgi:hypothetical protein
MKKLAFGLFLTLGLFACEESSEHTDEHPENSEEQTNHEEEEEEEAIIDVMTNM